MNEIEVAARAVASVIEQRGAVYAADTVVAVLREALGLPPEPMLREARLFVSCADRTHLPEVPCSVCGHGEGFRPPSVP